MGGNSKNGDSGNLDAETQVLEKEYQLNQQQIKEKTQQLDNEEMGFLHAGSGMRYEDPGD